MMLMVYGAAALILVLMITSRYCSPDYLIWYLRMRFKKGRLIQRMRAKAVPDRYDVVVSLTTIPGRIKSIFPTLNSVLLQSRPPDRIYLNIPERSKREKTRYRIPDSIQTDYRISICRCGEDLGPVLKLLPALEMETNPETVIITVDDDTVYPRHLIHTLLKFHQRLPDAALGFRGWRIPRSGKFIDRRVRFANQIKEPDRVDILSGVSGVLYLRKHFDSDFFRRSGLAPESYFVDDICISGYLEKAGVEKYLIPFPMREPFSRYLLTSRSNPLWMINRNGHNDQTMMDHFFHTAGRSGTMRSATLSANSP